MKLDYLSLLDGGIAWTDEKWNVFVNTPGPEVQKSETAIWMTIQAALRILVEVPGFFGRSKERYKIPDQNRTAAII